MTLLLYIAYEHVASVPAVAGWSMFQFSSQQSGFEPPSVVICKNSSACAAPSEKRQRGARTHTATLHTRRTVSKRFQDAGPLKAAEWLQ